jgi:dipeptidyl aminopeptidase/acylaminoacyl peptidase
MNYFLRQISENKARFCLALAALFVVFIWRLVVILGQPAGWQKMALELGSIPQFEQQLYASHASGAVVYTRHDEEKTDYYFCGGINQKPHLLSENLREFYGWSPDDTRLAYGMPSPAGPWEIVVCDGNTGEKLAELQHPGFSGPPMFAWLSSNSISYLLSANDNFDFEMIKQKPDGTWVKSKKISGVGRNISNFTSISDYSAAWIEQMGGVNQTAYADTNQQWSVSSVDGNQYKITAADGRALTGIANNGQLVLQTYIGADNQRWTFTANGDSYNIRNIGSGQNLDDWGGKGGIVGQYSQNDGNPNQQWQLIPIEKTSAGVVANEIVSAGLYKITCPSGGDYVLNPNDSKTAIRELDVASGIVKTIWASATTNLSEFLYSRESGEFLLKCPDKKGCSFLRYYPSTRWTADAGRFDNSQTATFRQASAWTDDSPTFVSSWKNNSPRSVFLSGDGMNDFHVTRADGSAPFVLPWGGGVTVHSSLYGNHLYVIGHPATEPPGLWDYDVTSGSLNCIVSGLERPLRYAKYITPIYGQLTNALGTMGGYSIWSPAKFSAQKKYPVIIGQTVNAEWVPYEQMAANSGCYFAIAHRPYWICKKTQDWPDDVLALYQLLAQNPNVDTNRIYLWGHSLETAYISRLLAEKPDLWKGVILFDPSGLPNLESLKNKKAFIITGKDSENVKQLLNYQSQADAAGVPLKLFLPEHDWHNAYSTRCVRERVLDFAEMLNDGL